MNAVRIVVTATVLAVSVAAHAGFVEYEQDKAGWLSAVGGNFTMLDFNFGQQVVVTDQYAALGALFTDGEEITTKDPDAFPNDGWGLRGAFPGHAGPITVEFAQPVNWIAIEHPGDAFIKLYSNNVLVYASSWSGDPPPSPYFFGIVSTVAFNKAQIIDPGDNSVFIDDLYFGAPIPGPGTAVVMIAAALPSPARRRRRA